MSQTPPPTPLWVTHSGEIVAAAAVIWGVITGAWSGIRRLLRWRDHRRELRAARDEALRVLLDKAREDLHDNGQEDDEDIRDRVARRKALVDKARDRFWLAKGHNRSAPSSAPDDEDSG